MRDKRVKLPGEYTKEGAIIYRRRGELQKTEKRKELLGEGASGGEEEFLREK